MMTDIEKRFKSWLITQRNARGTYYLERVANHYISYIRNSPSKLDIELPIDERNVFNCTSLDSFDKLVLIFVSAPNYKEVNSNGNRSFSSGLSAYRKYIQYLENGSTTENQVDLDTDVMITKSEDKAISIDPLTVDFSHPELCTGCNPISCVVEGKNLSGGNWRDVLVSVTEEFLQTKSRIKNLYHRSLFSNGGSEFLLKDKPKFTARKLSNGYWVNVNLSIKDLVITIGKLCQYCGVELNNVEITYVPKSSIKCETSKSALQSFPRDSSIKTLHYNDELHSAEASIPREVIRILKSAYSSGFRFESTYFNLLSNASGVKIDGNIQFAMKSIMFHRNDDIYFLLDTVADALTRKNIIDSANCFLAEYNCFEISELYKQYKEKINTSFIRNEDDFESFYKQLASDDIRCVQASNTGKIVRYKNDTVMSLFKKVADKIVSFVAEDYYGSCNEDDLQSKFNAFSIDLLGKIIKQHLSDELVRVEINGSICYQTFDALGLPEEFSEMLTKSLEQLTEIGLEPTQDALHTILSLELGVNLNSEYNLPDWDTYRRLVAKFYSGEPHREWKNNIFREITD